jgi:hypothetical protein
MQNFYFILGTLALLILVYKCVKQHDYSFRKAYLIGCLPMVWMGGLVFFKHILLMSPMNKAFLIKMLWSLIDNTCEKLKGV